MVERLTVRLRRFCGRCPAKILSTKYSLITEKINTHVRILDYHCPVMESPMFPFGDVFVQSVWLGVRALKRRWRSVLHREKTDANT